VSRSALLLRAVNVSGRNRVPMPELREALSDTGIAENVSTYIASGNIVCEHPTDPVRVCAEVRALISQRFGVDTPVIHRTHDELVAALAAQPFDDPVEKLLHAMFLEAEPRPGALDALRERLVPGEDIALVGRDLWINYPAAGVHATRLTKAVLDRALGVAGTARNLRTTRKLTELTA
jgi:uncharacterized protein (DUF1697 family)